MKIFIGNDHAGYQLKNTLRKQLEKNGHTIVDLGSYSDDSVDYPDFAHNVATNVQNDKDSLGILVCGSGNGVAMSANKHPGIRAALAWQTEIASLARQHNNANVLCLPARFISESEAIEIADAFLTAEFEGGRHERRVNKISC